MINKAIQNHIDSVKKLDESVIAFEKTLTEQKNALSGEDLKKFENLERDIKRAITMAKNGGDADSLANQLKKVYGT